MNFFKSWRAQNLSNLKIIIPIEIILNPEVANTREQIFQTLGYVEEIKENHN